VRRGTIAALLVLIVSACGGQQSARQATSTSPRAVSAEPVAHASHSCETDGRNTRGRPVPLPSGFRFCSNIRGYLESSIEQRDDRGGWRRVTGPPDLLQGDEGQWMNIFVSPDHKTLLAQWGGACEVPTAFFVALRGGKPRVVTRERDAWKAPMSIGLGWQPDGRARVAVLNSGCSPDYERPGIYLIDPKTNRGTLVKPLTRPADPTQDISRTCEAQAGGFRTCMNAGPNYHSTIEHRESAGTWILVTGPVQFRSRDAGGYWLDVFVSPDKKTLLAQWSGECESPNAFLVPARGGAPRSVSGERDWWKAPESGVVGWAKDGRAIVRLFGAVCGIGAHRPGVYLIDPETGRAEFARRLTRAEGG
jgi:hypothetical protein